MKLTNCPKCGSECLRDRWAKGRKLQQHCESENADECESFADNGYGVFPVCGWEGEPRTPEPQVIRKSKSALFGHGNCYETFDRYGHTLTFSRSYDSKKEAMPHIQKELRRGLTDADAGPYTALWWHGTTYLRGTEVKLASE